ncbi:abortive infection protein, AbiV family [Kaistella treverensis]|uniref:Abortive infection protein, AbiV family n=1 Tax=Kaistella treverensis TaxID=631455 RepID=A0A1I3KZC2_9FLAO|nr:AbiV family abortive infection protein [Kaistella treverensis]SFI77823.1 abortive infection protein, AbiV family [Kaistella treverensis]
MNLKKEELFELFINSLDNSYNLYESAKKILDSTKIEKHVSLGLAELALEELGKSYSCLAYYSESSTLKDWKDFWKEWKNHDLKAHRAFFYEFFNMLRIDQVGDNLNFPTNKDKFSKEKEYSFYVDIDKSNRKIYIPKQEISEIECNRRIYSLLGLFNSALYIKDWFNENKNEDFRNAISNFAFRTISTAMHQQDVNNVLSEMKTENKDYNLGLEKIYKSFNRIEE